MASAPEQMTPKRIAGYVIEGLLGSGATSRVYNARQTSLDRSVALKVFRLADDPTSGSVARLTREARLLARLDHENVVRCFDFGEEAGSFFLALELVDGESLRERLDRGPLEELEAIEIVDKVARGLAHAHENGIVHRDVKPGNVLLARDGRVKLTDFGLARGGEDLELTRPGTTVGTPQYLSPEQARNPRSADARSDLYSLGATFYHMVTGRPPHTGKTLAEVISHILFGRPAAPEELAKDLSPATAQVIGRMMARDRRRRYRSAEELLADLQALGQHREPRGGLSWEQATRPSPAPATPKRWRFVAAGAAVFALVLWLVGRAVLTPAPAEEDPKPPVVSAAAFTADDLRSGRLSLTEALERVNEDSAPALLDAVLAEADRRAENLIASARAAARAAIARGQVSSALDRFADSLGEGSLAAFGARRADLPPELKATLDDRTPSERQVVEQWLDDVRAAADAALTRHFEQEQGAVQARVDELDFKGARLRLEKVERELEGASTRAFAVAVKKVVPEARDPRAPEDWLDLAGASSRPRLAALSRVVERREQEVRDRALEAMESFDPDEVQAQSRAAMEDRLRRHLRVAIEMEFEDLPGEPGPIAEVFSGRVDRWEGEVAARQAEVRRQEEAALATALEARLRERDFRGAQSDLDAAGEIGVQSGWLAVLVAAVPELVLLEDRVLASFEGKVGGDKILVATRGISKRAKLSKVDRARRRLSFVEPAFEIGLDELAVEELIESGGVAASPRLAVLLHYFDGDLEAARGLLAESDAAPWRDALSVVVARVENERDRAERALQDRAEELLGAVDRAAEAGQLEEALDAVGELLGDADLVRQPQVRVRLKDLRQSEKNWGSQLDLRRLQAEFIEATAAQVRFMEDGRVELAHHFDSEAELEDFTLPGPEWRLRDGALSSVPRRIDDSANAIRRFQKRPGPTRSLPFDPEKSFRVALDLTMPYEQPDPSLVGFQIGSICFAIRSFEAGVFPGQVNAWKGDLEDFADYLFEPALGETHPRKKGGGNVETFGFQRGNTYHVALEWDPEDDGAMTLWIEKSIVYVFEGFEVPSRPKLEIRSQTPIVLDDLNLVGDVSGTGR